MKRVKYVKKLGDGLHIYYREDGEYPDTPFWNLVFRIVSRRAPEVRFLDTGNYFGFTTIEEWMDDINTNPDRWDITGTPANFQIFPTRIS